ncbi:MAG TPA: hypothetical protein VKB86_19520 [Pyrinomonadaceae bacterium]|nr:hypothetical protein [Pyrinomonadaceae bacterium]
MKNHLVLRVSVLSAVALALIALLVAAPNSTVRAQKMFASGSTPRIEITPLNNATALDDPEAEYQGARVVHNVVVDGQKGMRVHAKFLVRYGEDVHCMLIAYFYNDDGSPIEAVDRKYRCGDEGAVCARTDFTPRYDPAQYNDLQIFLPYSALGLDESGEYPLKFYLALYDAEGKRFFGKSGWYKFTMTK